MAVLGQYGLGMKLNAFNREFPVTHAHDFTVVGPGAHLETRGQTCTLDHQRMIARRRVGIRQSAKNAAAVMMNCRRLAMHELLRMHDLSAKRLPDALVA